MIFPEQKLPRMNGILQSFTGLGMLVGPIMGSILFKIGGFQLPFYSVGFLLLVLAFINYALVPSDLEEKCGLGKSSSSCETSEQTPYSSQEDVDIVITTTG